MATALTGLAEASDITAEHCCLRHHVHAQWCEVASQSCSLKSFRRLDLDFPQPHQGTQQSLVQKDSIAPTPLPSSTPSETRRTLCKAGTRELSMEDAKRATQAIDDESKSPQQAHVARAPTPAPDGAASCCSLALGPSVTGSGPHTCMLPGQQRTTACMPLCSSAPQEYGRHLHG